MYKNIEIILACDPSKKMELRATVPMTVNGSEQCCQDSGSASSNKVAQSIAVAVGWVVVS